MPLQSGSDGVLRAMRRSYRASKFLGILDRVRVAIPDAAITSDVIVGFPGETEEDFADTLRVVEAARFSSAFTFQYSQRPGTPAAEMPDQVPQSVVTERYGRLVELQERISTEENARQVGTVVEVLVSRGEGRKDAATRRISGRAADNRLVHLATPPDLAPLVERPGDPGRSWSDHPDLPRPGDLVTVQVTRSAPHHLLADSALVGGRYEVRRTRAGDAWFGARDSHGHGHDNDAAAGPVALGIPTRRG